jgi:uncharacterized protein YceH (UPF0502 family)
MTDEKSFPTLNAKEARVLGALMEKQLTTPEAYPLTLNSLVLACNQKTSREPVTNLSSGDVQHTVNALRTRELLEVDCGSRADRYHQRLTAKLFLDKPQQALLTIMLLRGPQTIGDLFTRTQRMTEFSSLQILEEKLQIMCQKVSPFIVCIPRRIGQREDRYMHLLCGEPDLSTIVEAAPVAATRVNNDLAERVAVMEERVANLMAQRGIDQEQKDPRQQLS